MDELSWLKLLFPYRTHLEAELIQQRTDFLDRLAEKDNHIKSLRLETAKLKEEVEFLRVRPAIRREPIPFATVPSLSDVTQDWQGELQKMLKEEEDGIRSGRRIQEHESRADDGA